MSDPVNPPPYNQAVGAPPMETKPYAGQDPAYPGNVAAPGQQAPYPAYPAYPPQQAGYPPQQAGYPPQQAGYPPQQAGYPPQQPHPAGYQQQPPVGYPQQVPPPGGYKAPTTVVIGQPTTTVTTVVHQVYREFPVQTTCPNCRNNVTTVVRKEPGAFAWILCLIIAFFGGWMGCCLIPFCVDGCQDCTHTCPVCQYQLGHYNRM